MFRTVLSPAILHQRRCFLSFLFGFELNGHCVFYGTQMTQIMQMTADLFLLRNAFLNTDDADNAEEGREMDCADTLQRKNLRRLRSKKICGHLYNLRYLRAICLAHIFGIINKPF